MSFPKSCGERSTRSKLLVLKNFRGLGMIQCLGHVGVNLRKKIRRHFSWPPQPEPHRCIEGGNCLGSGRQVR
jgi:hypothetical protein